MKIEGNIIDIHQRQIYPAEVVIKDGLIRKISRIQKKVEDYILPGLIDAHVHIESSMVTPAAFAHAVVSRGTVAAVSDPHEIANVLGLKGIMYMIKDAAKVPVKIYFGAPSCVPATTFETSGAVLGPKEIETLLEQPDIKYLSEMMNYPGVIYEDPDVLGKLEIAKRLGKPVDGHAPGLSGEMLRKYISGGITTDHECSTLSEAKEKLALGMKVIIREGSAARNLEQLKDLYRSDPGMIMLCTDDIHPEMLVSGHIDRLAARLISDGFDLFDVIRSCTINPAKHYNLETGLLREGDAADFIITDDYRKMRVIETWIDGRKVFDRGKVLFKYALADPVNSFNCTEINETEIKVIPQKSTMHVIQASDGELITREMLINVALKGILLPDIERDILKIVVKDRYKDAPPATGFINGFGMKKGALASSVAHDSHNIIAIGTNDEDIVRAINEIIRLKGGLAVSDQNMISSLQLDIAGLMSSRQIEIVAEKYESLTEQVKELGCGMSSPFMTLSFMALLVIPELKMSDRGLFNGGIFKHVPLFTD
jgi:adenine deaminase